LETRRQVAEEAARLLYNGAAVEYKDAKEMAASSLGVKSLPSNYEVAVELDRLSALMEGSERDRRLVDMRREALKVMKLLEEFNPKLIGSVWRGTARKGSDIDIIVYHPDPSVIAEKLSAIGSVASVEDQTFYVEGAPQTATHVALRLSEYDVEVVVRPPEEKTQERCEIYGDVKRGLSVDELERLMSSDPLRRFVPRRRPR
jgi:predicted nucleotidyltransferase